MIEFLIGKYPHIHKLNHFHIDNVTGNVHINEKKPILKYGFLKMKLDSDTLDEIKEIIESRIENDSENKKDKEITRLREENAKLINIVDRMSKSSNDKKRGG